MPAGCLWDANGMPTGCPRAVYGMQTGFLGMPTGRPRDAHGMPTGCPRDVPWDAHEIPTGYLRDSRREVSRGTSGKSQRKYATLLPLYDPPSPTRYCISCDDACAFGVLVVSHASSPYYRPKSSVRRKTCTRSQDRVSAAFSSPDFSVPTLFSSFVGLVQHMSNGVHLAYCLCSSRSRIIVFLCSSRNTSSRQTGKLLD